MVIDTSALLAIPQEEPEHRSFNEAIEAADRRRTSTATFLECSMILESRYGSAALRDLDHFIARAQITIFSVDVEQARIARDAFHQFGKGRHPAGLNFGECFAYALSCVLTAALLFKGRTFTQTDVLHETLPKHSIQDCGYRTR